MSVSGLENPLYGFTANLFSKMSMGVGININVFAVRFALNLNKLSIFFLLKKRRQFPCFTL
jgi:hypothetical protein